VSAPAARIRWQNFATTLSWPGVGRTVASTAGFNMALFGALGLGGVLLARTLGPTARGEYAAITAWLDVALIIGQCGQPAALCFYVARDPAYGRQYVATSRSFMLVTGALVLIAGVLFAPLLAHGSSGMAAGYRIACGAAMAALAGSGYVSSLQARDLHQWNVVRVSQPLLSLTAITGLWALRLLTLHSALTVLAVTLLLQAVYAYCCCRFSGLAPGASEAALVGPLASYGLTQLAALAPATFNAQLGQLVLSQTVPPADLGRYAIAVSLTLLPMPLVSAIGNVAFPRLAALRVATEATRRLQFLAVIGSAAIASAILLPLGAVAYWMVPLIFGAGYRGAVPLLWMLIPGAIFAACGQVVGDLLRGRNQLAVVAWAQGPSAVFLVVLLIVLLPIIGVMGAAISSTVAYGVALALMLWWLRRLPVVSAGPARSREARVVESLPDTAK
jgi:O-antigen/teichoic acid export membrane protein